MSEYVRQELLDEWIVAHDKQKARAEAAETERDEYKNALNWGVSCLNCSRSLDKSYADYVRADKAERRVARVEALRDEWASAVEPNGGVALAPVARLADWLTAALEATDD